MHILTFRIPSIRQVQQLNQQGDYAFSVDLKDAYLFIPIKYKHCIQYFVWQHKPHQWKDLPFVLAMAPRVFTSLTNPTLLILCYKGFHVIIYLDYILVLTCSKHADKRVQNLLYFLYVHLGLHINFSKSEFNLLQQFSF